MNKTLKSRVLAVLKAVEFSGITYDEETCCPICGSMDAHKDDCELAALIKELEQ